MALPEHDVRRHPLAPGLVGLADDGGLRDGRVRRQDVLDLAGVDVDPAGDDQVLLAVDDVHVALVVADDDVAAGEEAVVGRAGGGGLRVVVVAVHQVRRAAEQLARLAGRHRLAGVVDDPELGEVPRVADRARLAVLVDRPQVGDDAGLGRAVELVHADVRERRHHPLLERPRQRGGVEVERVQAGQVVRARRRRRRAPRSICACVGTRNADCTRSRSTSAEELLGVPGAQHGDGAAGEDRRVAEREAGAVVHRRDRRGDAGPVPRPHSSARHVEGERPAAVGDQHALGAAGRARGVGDAERVLLADRDPRVDARSARGQRPRRTAVAGTAAEGQASRQVRDVADHAGERVVEDERPGAGLCSRMKRGLGRGQPGVERHHHQPGLGDAGGDLGVLQPVAEQHGHPVPGCSPAPSSWLAEPARALVERGEGQRPVTVDHGRGIAAWRARTRGARWQCSCPPSLPAAPVPLG